MTRRCGDHAEPLNVEQLRPLASDGHHEHWQTEAAARLDGIVDEWRGMGFVPRPLDDRELDLLVAGEHFVVGDRTRPARGIWHHVARLSRRRVVVHSDGHGFALNFRPNGVDSWAGFSHDVDGWLCWVLDGKLAMSWLVEP